MLLFALLVITSCGEYKSEKTKMLEKQLAISRAYAKYFNEKKTSESIGDTSMNVIYEVEYADTLPILDSMYRADNK